MYDDNRAAMGCPHPNPVPFIQNNSYFRLVKKIKQDEAGIRNSHILLTLPR